MLVTSPPKRKKNISMPAWLRYRTVDKFERKLMMVILKTKRQPPLLVNNVLNRILVESVYNKGTSGFKVCYGRFCKYSLVCKNWRESLNNPQMRKFLLLKAESHAGIAKRIGTLTNSLKMCAVLYGKLRKQKEWSDLIRNANKLNKKYKVPDRKGSYLQVKDDINKDIVNCISTMIN